MKKLSFLFLFIVFSLLLSCNNKTTAPETTVSALDNIKKLAGKYSGIKQGEYYNNVTIKDDGSLFVEYNNGDGTGDQTLNIVPDKITESQENAYNFHYTAQDGTGEKRFVTLISYDTRFIKLIGWQTKSSGFLCNETSLVTKSGIEKYAATYQYMKGQDALGNPILDPNNSITISADGSMTFKENAQAAAVATEPGFTVASTENQYINFIFSDRTMQIETVTNPDDPNQSVNVLYITGQHGLRQIYIQQGVIQ